MLKPPADSELPVHGDVGESRGTSIPHFFRRLPECVVIVARRNPLGPRQVLRFLLQLTTLQALGPGKPLLAIDDALQEPGCIGGFDPAPLVVRDAVHAQYADVLLVDRLLLFATDSGAVAALSTEFFLLEQLLATGMLGDTNIAANSTKHRWILQMNRAGTNCSNTQIASDVLDMCQDDCDVQRVKLTPTGAGGSPPLARPSSNQTETGGASDCGSEQARFSAVLHLRTFIPVAVRRGRRRTRVVNATIVR